MAKEITLEEALEIIKKKNETIATLTEKTKVQAKEIKELKASAEKTIAISLEVPGVYRSEKHDVSIRFAKGCVKTRIQNEIVDSKEIIKNKNGEHTEFLDDLIEKKAGIIEVIND